MAIQHSKRVLGINVLNTGSKDVVCEVEVEFTSYDDSDQERTSIDDNITFELATEDRSSSSDGWVAFDSLTEETIYGWLGSELTDAETNVQTNHTSWINSVLNPPTPPTVNKSLPW